MRIVHCLVRAIHVSCLISAVILLIATAVGAEQAEQPRKIMLAGTIGPIDAGIVGAPETTFTKKTGITVEHTGTGKALKMAETGKYDLVSVHAKALEEKFVAERFGTKRYDLYVQRLCYFRSAQ